MYGGGDWAADASASSTDIENNFPQIAHSHAIGELPKRKAGRSRRSSTARAMDESFTALKLRAELLVFSSTPGVPSPLYEHLWDGIARAKGLPGDSHGWQLISKLLLISGRVADAEDEAGEFDGVVDEWKASGLRFCAFFCHAHMVTRNRTAAT
jgi:hypothetical protein